MSKLENDIHAELRLLYQNATDNIENCKKRQWLLTSQTPAIYGVLYFVDTKISDHECLSDFFFVFLALITAILSSYLISAIHKSASAERGRINYISERFSRQFRYARDKKWASGAPESQQIAEDIKIMQIIIVWLGLFFFFVLCMDDYSQAGLCSL